MEKEGEQTKSGEVEQAAGDAAGVSTAGSTPCCCLASKNEELVEVTKRIGQKKFDCRLLVISDLWRSPNLLLRAFGAY